MSGVVAVVGEVVVVAVLPVIAGKEIEAWRRLKGITPPARPRRTGESAR